MTRGKLDVSRRKNAASPQSASLFWAFYGLINQLNKVSLSSLLEVKYLAKWENGKTNFNTGIKGK